MPRSLWTPTDPPRAHQIALFVLASEPLKSLPSALGWLSPPTQITGLYQVFRKYGHPCGLCGSLCTLHLYRSAFASFTTATLGMNGWLGLVQQGLSPCKKRQASLGARRGREGSYPPSPRTDPGVRNYRTGLFRDTRFRMIAYLTTNCLFPAVRLAQGIRPCMSDLCFLCGLRIPVSSFPV